MRSCPFCGCAVKRLLKNGKPFKYCSADCDKAAMTMRSIGLKFESPNPLCRCGCGQEVARPWNEFIQGHTNKPKIRNEEVDIIKRLLKIGFSQQRIADFFSVTQATICGINLDEEFGIERRKDRRGGREIVRLVDIKRQKQAWSELQWLRQGKALLKETKKMLREMR